MFSNLLTVCWGWGPQRHGGGIFIIRHYMKVEIERIDYSVSGNRSPFMRMLGWRASKVWSSGVLIST